jgi:pimeloyl-ACP methyl ester carboxylesterase
MDRLAGRFRVIAVDLYGSGKTVAWPHDQPMLLDDEVALLRSVFLAAGDRFHLIGHSYGGAVALKATLTHQHHLISLVLYEPVLFSVLMANASQSDAAREIVAVRDDTIRLVDEGELNASAERFVDYRLLTRVLPRVRVQRIEGVGHMAPVTHPERVNPLIERFLEATRIESAL